LKKKTSCTLKMNNLTRNLGYNAERSGTLPYLFLISFEMMLSIACLEKSYWHNHRYSTIAVQLSGQAAKQKGEYSWHSAGTATYFEKNRLYTLLKQIPDLATLGVHIHLPLSDRTPIRSSKRFSLFLGAFQ
jgi:hypothetical protein